MSDVSGKGQTPYARNAKVSRLQFDSPKTSDGNYHDNPELGKDEEDEDLKSRVNLDSPQGTNFISIPHFSQKESIKDDHAGSTDNMKQAGIKTAGAFGDAPGEVIVKQKGWRESPHVDVSGWDPSMAFTSVSEEARETLLRGHYPVDTYEQVKTASVYFEENWKQFSPRDRHTYCVKLAEKLETLGLPISEDVERYGSTGYSVDVDDLTATRRSLVSDEFHPSLDMLLEKRASLNPETFVEALSEFDQMTGLNHRWGSHIADPWYTTFGPSKEKIASDSWVFDHMGTRIREANLKALALNGPALVRQKFGEKFTAEFQKAPKSFFMALPKPHQLVLARLADDPHAGTFSE